MDKIRCMKADDIIWLAEELMDKGKRVRITVTGMSMYPFLREHKDSVELIRCDFQKISRGDIILIRDDSQEYVLHRIFRRKRDCVFINGDAQQWTEGPFYPEQVIAKVMAVWRGESYIQCSGWKWKALTRLWMLAYPFRSILISAYRIFYRHFLYKSTGS